MSANLQKCQIVHQQAQACRLCGQCAIGCISILCLLEGLQHSNKVPAGRTIGTGARVQLLIELRELKGQVACSRWRWTCSSFVIQQCLPDEDACESSRES